jgi:ATP-dependent protease ClpP protease subunit
MPTKAMARPPARGKVIAKGDFWTVRAAADTRQAQILIYGDIGESFWGEESVSARELVGALTELEADDIFGYINSYGGSVADGVSIYNALRRHSAKIHIVVDGVAVSIASLIAMAGDEVKVGYGTRFMVHAPLNGHYGNATTMRRNADVLDGYADAMVAAYSRHMGEEKSELIRSWLMGEEDHWFNADEAIAIGLADGHAEDIPSDLIVPASASGAFAAMFTRYQLPAAAAASLKERYMPKPNEAAPNPVAAVPATAVPPAAPPAAEPFPDLKAQAKAYEAERQTEIRDLFAIVGSRPDAKRFEDLRDRCLIDANVTVDVARDRLLSEMGKDVAPLAASPRVEPGAMDERTTFRDGAVAALLHRAAPSQHAMTEPARNFRGMNLVRMAEEVLRTNGVSTRGLVPAEIAIKALHSTSDFPAILENVVTKTLRQAYESAPRTFLPWTRRATLPDFKEVSRAQLGGAPSLQRVVEGGEYTYGTIGEGAEKYRVQKYGRLVAITWETVVNDDLNAFVRLPQMFGRSAADLESDIVYGILTSNPQMQARGRQGTEGFVAAAPLFDAAHANVGTAAAIGDASLGEMREKMLMQKGIEGRFITVQPQFLIVPPALQTIAQKNTALPIQPNKAADANPFYNALDLIVEPRLQADSATKWYGAASPNQVDTIEYGYLEGFEGVYTETKQGFEVDGVMVKCRHVFGAKAIDWVGMFRNG